MTRDEAADYLTIGEVMQATDVGRDLAVIEFANDRGYYTGVWPMFAIECATIQVNGMGPEEGYEYDGDDLEEVVRDTAREAVEWLNDEGLLPDGYGYDDTRPGDGFGLYAEEGQ